MSRPSAVGDQLVAAGRVALIQTVGRVTGSRVAAAVGFVEEPDGTLLVAASSASTHWARNLVVEPRCRVTIGERSFAAVAEPLDKADRIRAVRELILKYGTPSEALGGGPAFRLRPGTLRPAT